MSKPVGISRRPKRIFALSLSIGLAVGVMWSGVVMASSTQPSDEGINVDLSTVETLSIGTDAQGVEWSLVQYRSSVGGCLDLEGEFNGDRVSIGGCDPDPSTLGAPSIGGAVVGGQRMAVAFGVLSGPAVNVRAVLIDRTVVDAQVADGVWLVSIPTQDIEAVVFQSFDILDAQGALVESVVVESLLSGDAVSSDHKG